MARANIELKARLTEPEAALRAALDLGAEDRGILVQRDTYFTARHGRLKLREIEGQPSELIAYHRADDAAARQSDYVISTVPATETREALEATLGIRVVVAKRRRLLLWEGVRIHLDEVEGLGSFLEFEAVLPEAGDEAQAHEKVRSLRERLNVKDEDVLAAGYADLLQDGEAALLQAAGEAMRNAYAPYSNFKVGAALRAASGAIYTGANVENGAYPQSQCAEASAIGAMVSAGETRISAVAVVAEGAPHCPPCGGCRQRLSEFAHPDTPVLYEQGQTTVGGLLPDAFELERA